MVHRLGSSTAHSKEHHSLSSRRSHPATAHITSQLLVSHGLTDGVLESWHRYWQAAARASLSPMERSWQAAAQLELVAFLDG